MTAPATDAWRWHDQACNDLELARLALGAGFFAQTCFMSQQVAEKALKALHYAAGARAVIGHSVAGLLADLDDPLPHTERHRQAALLLDQYYIATRYPNGLPAGIPATAYTHDQASNAVGDAQAMVDAVAARLPPRP